MRVIRQIDSKEILVLDECQKVVKVLPRGKYPDDMPMGELSKMVIDEMATTAVQTAN
jgi:hypothetical protein